ncbi:MAG: hypothetical protein JO364_00225 [Pseudonocardiales bacterium]|nr:hypothetical protein [Pseudonocardiales bacterium]
MDCAECRQALSARQEDEASAVGWDVIDAHLTMCAMCRWFAAKAARVTRLARAAVAASEPDVIEAVLRVGSGPRWREDQRHGADVRAVVAAARWCGCPCCRRLTALLTPSP